MSNISRVFQQHHKALIAYVTAGYPTPQITLEAIPLLAETGCDIVEIGIPFSDPLADGTTIQKASSVALHNGITPVACLEMVRQIRKRTRVPLVFMSYYNPVYRFGIDKFIQTCTSAGVDGLIIPDLPPEEGAVLETTTVQNNMDLIYLAAPTSTEERIKTIASHSRGFIYLVSVTGVTGTRDAMPADLVQFASAVRKLATKPLCIGFGISTPEQVRQIARFADGVIIGSRIVQIMEKPDWKTEIVRFIKSVRQALDSES